MYTKITSMCVVALLAGLTANSAIAGNSWFSKVHERASVQLEQDAFAKLAVVSNDSTKSVFDIVISLESNPQGDDDSTADSGASDDAQNKYEKVIQEFADGVCQATNTAHKLGVVRVFRELAQQNSADILWNINCASNQGPRAHPSGFGKAGHRIWMCDNWAGAGSLLDQPKPAGFTIAHEWGHYAYGLYDEYIGSGTGGSISSPRSTDTQTSPSLMNNQWCAAGLGCPSGFTSPDLDFLEFSTDQVAPFSTGSTGTNAQKRVFGKSGWDALVQLTSDDPKSFTFLGISFGFGIPTRTRYTTLGPVKPPTAGDNTVNNDESTCRSSLDIRWMQKDVINELVLDRSGSMGGTKIANARTAASLLIDQLPVGNAAIGVASFSTSLRQDFAIADIPDPDTGIKTAAKAAVAAINAGGGTHLFDGAMFGLNQVEAFASASATPNRAKVVFLLGDGDDFGSTATSASVIAAYAAADVPIISFGFGTGAPTSVLQALASGTGGTFIQSPTSLAAIQQAFLAANAAVSSSVIINNSVVTASSAAATNNTVNIDSTLKEVVFTLIYNGVLGELDIELLNPAGIDTGVAFSCQPPVSSEVSCSGTADEAIISAAGNGNYTLVLNNSSGADLDVRTIIGAAPTTGDTFDVAIGTSSATASVNYPDDIAITAAVTRGAAIAGLHVTAEITDPFGAISNVNMHDDGLNGDSVVDDGIYSVIVNYNSNGAYTVTVNIDNDAGTGIETIAGQLVAINADGSVPAAGAQPAVTQAFSRSGTTQFSVAGFLTDDHDNDPTGVACTLLTDDNSDTRGRIDTASDIDCFTVVPTDATVDLVFRTTGFSNGMDPVVNVFELDGVTLVATFNAANSENIDSGIIGTVAAASLNSAGMIATVEHADATASTGGYSISVGVPIHSDVQLKVAIAPPADVDNTSGSSGSSGLFALNPLLLVLGIPLMLLLRRIRRM